MNPRDNWIAAMHPDASKAERRAIARELVELDRLERAGKIVLCHSTDPAVRHSFLHPGEIVTEARLLAAVPTARHPWPPAKRSKQ
jgi:hypothetical protein